MERQGFEAITGSPGLTHKIKEDWGLALEAGGKTWRDSKMDAEAFFHTTIWLKLKEFPQTRTHDEKKKNTAVRSRFISG